MTPFGYFALFMFILVIIIFLAAKKNNASFVSRFLDKLSVINGFLAAFGIYITYSIFKAQSDKMSREITLSLIDRSWLKINQSIKDSQNTCPTLVNSLYFPWQIAELGSISNTNSTKTTQSDNWSDCSYLSILMFQAWEDYLSLTEFDETGDVVWIANFSQWAASDKLRKNWAVLKTNFAPTTIEFGDYLFNIMRMAKPANQADHLTLSTQIATSEILKKIKSNRNNIVSTAFSII